MQCSSFTRGSEMRMSVVAALLAGVAVQSAAHETLRGGALNATRGQSKRPPSRALDYNGIAWPAIEVLGPGPTHVFAIGDWGGMDGAFQPGEGRAQIIAYPGGHEPGPHIFPRSRPGCRHSELVDCYFPEKACKFECGFAAGIDDQAQTLVAAQFRKRAALKNPQYILNSGDNFYWGGIEKDCGSSMSAIHWITRHQFDAIFEGIYSGPGLDGKKWLSVLGNHDWGGRKFNNGWDQQIAYTWASSRWVMPAAYFSQRVDYLDQGFSVDYYMLDSNALDAFTPPESDPEHNICGSTYVPPGASCAAAGGPPSVEECYDWFWRLWREQQRWLEQQLATSIATWQVVVTHFPCGHEAGWYRMLHDVHGLDLLVTGHRHDQELWKANGVGYAGMLGGLTCFVTGGGGGITSEHSILPQRPTDNWPNVVAEYGFFDLTVSKQQILIEAIDHNGSVVDSTVVQPKAKR